jgi:hypothetical protein
MIFRVLALVFFGASIVTGFALGWGTDLGAALQRGVPGVMRGLENGVKGYLLPDAWDALFVPLFSIPAWSGWILLGVIFFIVSALQPAKV